MAVKIAINGFGRIGRLVARAALQRNDIELVAVNDLGDPKGGAHLFKYDSIHGVYDADVSVQGEDIVVGNKKFKYLSQKDPEQLPWADMGVQVIVEATGVFRSRDGAAKHLKAGASKVVLTAPGKNMDLTIVMGVNEDEYKPEHDILSNASCTTNCLTPVAKVLHDDFGIVKGVMNTVHSYTNDQKVLDLEHNDLRRARAAAISLIPTTTGAAGLVGKIIPELDGKLDGLAIRVPTPNVSLVDFTVELEKEASAEAINMSFKKASETNLKGIIKYTEEPLVSSDYNGEEHSAVIDGLLTMVMGNKMAKVIAWYDNEWGYSLRVLDTVTYIASKGLK
ncbi:NAD-dependent glyceraldehyde-3-phosphate dehydrogenase [Candidatus Syntrophocurvum alkaliphilum]|uniref:Glyceraldehyde-3-phosphate dehydrogenase n=1 Tax=Candidatus Syntrophocurvum alkaliphilum TaxID=2293317 RepID=A0A6I6DJV6_9FIRM|nr:type I glyceraldehyde-3-phosphate dehydrogenase [Candidatus Syntrophocurvum alkaliphilum]QGU00357.1 NAD-dependent glyceraldehyde-3-phosphate dehydrogenase [Candidatus Syntrophocurvum alkaliphilum]